MDPERRMKPVLRLPIIFSCLVIATGLILSPNKVDPFAFPKHLFLWLITAVSFSVTFFLAKKVNWKNVKIPDVSLAILLALLAFLPRLASIHLLDIKPESDFGAIHQMAVAWASNQYTPVQSTFTHPIYSNNSVVVFGLLYKIFGPDILVIKLFNTLCAILTTILLYYAGRRLFGRTYGIAAALLFAFFPTAILYVNILSSEHLYILFSALFLFVYIYTLLKPAQSDLKTLVTRCIGYLVLGVIIALNDAFRPFGAINLIAMVITDLVFLPRPYRSKQTFYRLVPIPLTILAYLVLMQIPVHLYEQMNQTRYINMKSANILIGMNFVTSGRYNEKDWQYANQVLADAGDDESQFNRVILNTVIERVKTHPRQVLSLIIDKTRVTWSGDLGTMSATTGTNVLDIYTIRRYAFTANKYYLGIIVLLMLASIITPLHSTAARKAYLLTSLCILGFTLLQFIAEAQDRYAIVLLPFFSFIAAGSIAAFLKTLWRNIHFRRGQAANSVFMARR